MGSSTAALRRLENSVLPFLLLLLAFGMMECAPAEAARVLKANLVIPNGPTSTHNALQSPASDQFSPVPAAEHPPPVQTAVGSEPSDGSAAVTSEPSIDPLVVVSAVNGGDEEAGNEPDGANSSAAAAAPVPTSWLRPAQMPNHAQMPNDPQPNDHGPFLLETDPMPAVGSEEEAPAGNEDGLVPEIYVALPEEAAPAEAPAGSQGVAPTPDATDSSGSGPVPSAWLRQAKIKGDHQVPNDHGPYLLGTDAAISAVGSEEAPAGNENELVPAVLVPHPEEAAPGEAPAGNEDVLVPEIYVALPEDSAPGEAPAGNEDGLVPEICVALPEEAAPGEAAVAGSQGDAPMPDGAESSALVPIPNDHGPYLLGVDSTVGSEEEASVGEEQAPVKLPDVLVPLPEESASGEAEAAGSVAPEN